MPHALKKAAVVDHHREREDARAEETATTGKQLLGLL
jgi:hypothetical protein